MSSFGSMSRFLPKAKYTGENEELKSQSQGPKVVSASSLENQVVIKRPGPPPYRQRTGWRPRAPEDFGDGGAFPEIPVAQYPLDMGRKTQSSSNALAVTVNADGQRDYTALAKRGHREGRMVQASFADLIPLRQRAETGEIDLSRPSAEEVEATRERTQAALEKLVSGAVAAQKPKNVQGLKRDAPTYVRFQPSAQMGDTKQPKERIIKIVQRQMDPLEPPKHKHKKIPRGPPSPPPPVLHSPPRKLTAADQEAWRIPPPVSNWKNPKGYTIPLDKRLAADGRGLQDVTISDEHAKLAEALNIADRQAREEVKQRAAMQQKLAEKEKQQKEEHLRMLAQKAREDRALGSSRRDSRSRSHSSYESDESGSDREDVAKREREEMRRERRRENERQLRQSRMGAERRLQMMAREQGRDISEKIALGIAKPTASGESMYDSRLFNQSSGFATGFNEDQPYDKPLFAAQEAISSIYRPKITEDDGENADEAMERIQKSGSKRFEGFSGTRDAEAREGPVQFEKDKVREMKIAAKTAARGDDDDPFGIDEMISEVTGGKAGKKRYGLNEPDVRESKRARVDEDSSGE